MKNNEKIQEIIDWVKDESLGNFMKDGELKEKLNTLVTYKNTRSAAQNRAIHLYCQQFADKCNELGISMQELLKKTIEISPTKDSIKHGMWAVINKALFNKKSTKDHEKDEVTQVYEHMNRFSAENFHFSIPFPSDDYYRDVEN